MFGAGIWVDGEANLRFECPRHRSGIEPMKAKAKMLQTHRDLILNYFRAKKEYSSGVVEGLNNKIRVIQRRAYGLRDQEYLRLKVLTCMLPAL